jgi:hypothetical protein
VLSSTLKKPALIGALLVALMAATRYQHLGSASHLADASFAVFLLAGFYLRSPWVLLLLLAEAALIDYAALAGGVSGWCVTPAYAFLIPAYGVLWLGGGLYRRMHSWTGKTFFPLAGSVLVSVAIAFAISNGSFYLLAGYFPEMSWSEYASGVAKYFPLYLGITCLYVALAAVVHALARAGAMRGGPAQTR